MDSLPDIVRILQVMLGIGLVIFVHELGHFLAARWHKVRVEIFSLGFGPPMFAFQRGDTIYQVAWVPLGGFVRMAGEERRTDGLPPAHDDLCSKSVGARFFIYSAGVIMNVIFGLVVFPILFTVGLPITPPVLGPPSPGSSAWVHGLEAETEILEVNGSRVYEYDHVLSAVALGDPEVDLLVRHPDGLEERVTLEAQPTFRGIYTLDTVVPLEVDGEGHELLQVVEGGAAWRAGLRQGDALLETLGAAPGMSARRGFESALLEGRPLRLRVKGPDGERVVHVTPDRLGDAGPPLVGISPPRNRVAGVRGRAADLDLRVGESLLRVGAMPILRDGDLARALIAHVQDRPGTPARFVLEEAARDGEPGDEAETPPAPSRRTLEVSVATREDALALAGDIGLSLNLGSTVLAVRADGAAKDAGLRDGDRVLSVGGGACRAWEDVRQAVAEAGEAKTSVDIEVQRSGVEGTVLHTVYPREDPLPEYGLGMSLRVDTFRTDGPIEAIGVGAVFSWRFFQDTWIILTRVLTQDLAAKDVMGGPIAIGALSYSVAGAGWAKLFFFLCMLSINLAVINLLPIPVLDGGHLTFLIIEKIKGSPVSERVLGYSQMVGLVLILSLFVFVTYNDIRNWFPGFLGD